MLCYVIWYHIISYHIISYHIISYHIISYYIILYLDSMLPCVCSVIDHRWRQNVVRTKKWHTRSSRVCHWCSYHIFTSSVIYYWIRRMATWNLFVLYHNEKPFLFQNVSTYFCPAFSPPLHAEKKPFDSFDVIWLIQNEAISLVAMLKKEL